MTERRIRLREFDDFHQTRQAVQSENALGELIKELEGSRARTVARKLFDGDPFANAANVLYRHLVRSRSDDGAARGTEWIVD